MAVALAAAGHELQIIVPWRDNLPPKTADASVTVHWTRYAPVKGLNLIGHGRSLRNDMQLRRGVFTAIPFFLFAALAKAIPIIRRWQPEVVHSHWALPSGVVGALSAMIAGAPHVVSLHGSDLFVANSRSIFRSAARFVFRNASQVIACSQYLAEQAIALGAEASRVHFVPYGVDELRFAPADDGAGPLSAPVVLAAGRLVEKKGFRLLIEHADSFLDSHPDAELWIAGDGDQRSELEELIGKKTPAIASRIRMLGNVDWGSMPDMLRRASVFVMPSIRDSLGNQDGLPNVVLEAMSCGRTVVASDLGGISSLIEHDITGILFPAGDGTQLAREVNDLLADRAKAARLGAAAAERVRAHHTWRAYAQTIERLYLA